MKIAAVICEYNPLHNGHLYQVDKIREKFGNDTIVAAVMSGDFVQRGEPALYGKYERAEAAVRNGINLVLELPFPWCCSSAERFAAAGVHIASSAGAETLVFGSESGDVNELKRAAVRLDSNEFSDYLNTNNTDSTLSYMYNLTKAYSDMYGEELPTESNNSLGIAYIRALNHRDNPLDIYTIPRDKKFSATSARMALESGNTKDFKSLVPREVTNYFEAYKRAVFDKVSSLVIDRLYRMTKDEMTMCADVDATLAGRIKNALGEAVDVSGIIEKVKTKKYTTARIKRALLNSVCGTTDSDLNQMPEFTLLLAADDKGRELLASIRKSTGIQIVTKPSDTDKLNEKAKKQYEKELDAERLYSLICRRPINEIMRKKPYMK